VKSSFSLEVSALLAYQQHSKCTARLCVA